MKTGELFERAKRLLDNEWRHSWHWGTKGRPWQEDALATAQDSAKWHREHAEKAERLAMGLRADLALTDPSQGEG